MLRNLRRVGATAVLKRPLAASHHSSLHRLTATTTNSNHYIPLQPHRQLQRRSQHTWADITPRNFAALEDSIVKSVGTQVVDPILQKDLASLKWLDRRIQIKGNGDTATLSLRLPSRLHPALAELKERVQTVAQVELEQWMQQNNYQLDTTKLTVEVTKAKALPQHPQQMTTTTEDSEDNNQLGPGLANVSQFLAVYSCKGGVGKSTIAVNLAYEMAQMGGNIGLLDVDIYGPSLPILLKPDDAAIRPSPLGQSMVYPITHRGVKVLSLGYVSPKSGVPGSGPQSGSAIMRGPLVGRVVTQLLKGTDWGELDVLILDLPPGTGDVQLTVCQELQMDGAVAVTTPSALAVEDTRKGIQMFSSLGVPTMALVENMSYFVCEGGGRHYPFGKGQLGLPNKDEDKASIVHPNTVQLPISQLANDANDRGEPLTLVRPEKDAEEELQAFTNLAQIVSRELLLAKFEQAERFVHIDGVGYDLDLLQCSIVSDPITGKKKDDFVVRLYSDAGATQVRVPASHIRLRDPKTGDVLEGHILGHCGDDKGDSSNNVVVSQYQAEGGDSKDDPKTKPVRVEKKGKYGFTVEWADGATIIYAVSCIGRAAKEASEKSAR